MNTLNNTDNKLQKFVAAIRFKRIALTALTHFAKSLLNCIDLAVQPTENGSFCLTALTHLAKSLLNRIDSSCEVFA